MCRVSPNGQSQNECLSRREFIIALGCTGALRIPVLAQRGDDSRVLYNINYQTAIGLGDEPASIVDRFGQFKSDDADVPELANAARGGGSRNVNLLVAIGELPSAVSTFQSLQRLEDGYLPIVHTQIHTSEGPIESVAFSSDAGGIKADYLNIRAAAKPIHIRLLCPTTTLITVDGLAIRTPDRILAIVSSPQEVVVRNAKYNYLTPERNSRVFPSAVAWEGLPHLKCPSFLDESFATARTGTSAIEYSFPVVPGKTYHVYLGVGNPKWLVGSADSFQVVKLTVDEQSRTSDLSAAQRDHAILEEFTVQRAGTAIRVRSEGIKGGALLSGIWIFEGAADPRLVISGRLNGHALYHADCGRETAEEIVSSVDLEYRRASPGGSAVEIRLPYLLHSSGFDSAKGIAIDTALSATKMRWQDLLNAGAQLMTGVSRLDSLYKTSLINLFLLRTKYSGQGTNQQDIYAVKPGATVYDSFWYRDGSYMVAAMDAAGHPDEAEKSLRLFTDRELSEPLKKWGQQPSGAWESPSGEWDSQGQAIWALVHHFELTGDLTWLRTVYENIRKGVLWIKKSTEKTKIPGINGARPISRGLLERGVSEDTGSASPSYVYEHDFWATLGLKKAILASQFLKEENDTQWMNEMYREFCGNLLASVERAYRETGENRFIPADPFDPSLDINGDIAAVYPTGFLDARDPMVAKSLRRIAIHSREGLYTWFKTLNNGDMWTYMTADWAMCYLLGDQLPMFYRLFQSYADHAAPTNNWSECIYSDSRLGTGDTPHGWAAASFILLYRNALIYEDGDKLQLCWGVFPEWLRSGAHIRAKSAPTRFGDVNFELRRSGSVIDFSYLLVSRGIQQKPNEVRLHIPPAVQSEISEVRVNGKSHSLRPGESVLRLE